MDLADKLIERQHSVLQEASDGGQTYVDDLGIPTVVEDKDNPVELKNNVDYYVCRIIVLNNKKVEEGTQGRLHRRGSIIYIGSDMVQPTDANLFRLCSPQWAIPVYLKSQIWDRLYWLLPELDHDKIVLSDHLIFNKKTGSIEWTDDEPLTTGAGGFNS